MCIFWYRRSGAYASQDKVTIKLSPIVEQYILVSYVENLQQIWASRASSNRNGQKNRKIGIRAPKK